MSYQNRGKCIFAAFFGVLFAFWAWSVFAQDTAPEMAGVAAWVEAHKLLVYTVVLFAGAVLHYFKEVWSNETSSTNIVEYWFGVHGMRGGGALFAIGLLFWAAASTTLLSGMGWVGLVELAAMTGYGIDSIINKGADPIPKPLQ